MREAGESGAVGNGREPCQRVVFALCWLSLTVLYPILSFLSFILSKMGRTLSSASRPAIATVVSPAPDAHIPSYANWSYQNAWDPDSDEFFEDAVYEAFLIPGEPITPVASSDGSSASSSGRGTPTGAPPPLGEDSSNDAFLHWVTRMVPDSLLASRPPPQSPGAHLSRPRSQSAATAPLVGVDEEMVSHYAARYDIVSQAALERMEARQRSRMVSYTASAVAPEGTDAEVELGDGPGLVLRDYAVPSAGLRQWQARVSTSDITPIQLPSVAAHTAFVALQRPSTPPAAPIPIPRTPDALDGISLSPPPSVSPHVYRWPDALRGQPAASPSIQTRARVGPARWPMY
ncbi:hypothetical protein FA95DRAFT_213556 [Auriscalpium vulgare]|uniref:Uncharacterized protein n=1 Tax=Auriscalpium vulgare TaxID=40419 RepID=A0ACB8RLK7_9AGAM|nr:hypothetical protein FA95DRAFT_213556 [Auriscalpium vulgare]